MSSKGSKSSKSITSSGSKHNSGSSRDRKRNKGLKESAFDPVQPGREVSPVSLTSPTGITHSAPRARAPVIPITGGFLAAEQFSKVSRTNDGAPTPSRIRMRSGAVMTPEHYLSSFNCNAPLNEAQKEVFALYQSDSASRKSTSSSRKRGGTSMESNLNCKAHVDAFEREVYAIYRPDTSGPQHTDKSQDRRKLTDMDHGLLTFEDAREGCINPIIEQSKKVQEAMPSQEEVRYCVVTGKGRADDCASRTYEFYRDSCGIGNHRGDDQEFFLNPNSNPQTPGSPRPRRGRSETREDRHLRKVDSTEDTIRKRSLRYPEAALVENPDLISQSTRENSDSIGEDAASIIDIPPVRDTPTALRDYRLSLLFQGDATNAQVVPISRLSRALNELNLQDLTVDELNEELLLSKEVLTKTQAELKHNELIAKKHQTAVTDLKAKFLVEKQSLNERLQRESAENAKLQTKLSALQLEVSQLRSNLRSTTSELKKTSNKWVEESRNDSTSKASGRSADYSIEDTALVSALRSEISDLKNQLEHARMHEHRTGVSHDYDQSDVMRLKAHLERAEVELLRLKDAHDMRTTALDPAAKELKAALAASEEALRLARKKEQILAEELEDTKAILASLEASSRSKHHESVAEVENLSSRIGLLESEAEKAQKRADEALELCRLEAEELRSEIRRLSQELDDEIARSHYEASERLKERLEFEFTLEKKEEEGKSFSERIKRLEASLAKAEREALESAASDASRKLESDVIRGNGSRSMLLGNHRGEFQQFASTEIVPDSGSLHHSPGSRESEVSSLAAVVKACDHGSTLPGKSSIATEDAASKSSDLDRELSNLREQLLEQTAQAARTQQERERIETELQTMLNREKNLVNEMGILKSRLENAETKVSHEIFRAEEERRMAVETDAERVIEIKRLKEELHRAKTGNSSPDAMKELARRIEYAETERDNRRLIENAKDKSLQTSGAKVDEVGSDSLKTIRAKLIANCTGSSPSASYEDPPSFVSSSNCSSESSDVSISTMQTSNVGSPTMRSDQCLTSSGNPLKSPAEQSNLSMQGSTTSRAMLDNPSNEFSPRSKMSDFRNPRRSKELTPVRGTDANRSIRDSPSPPLSPPRLKKTDWSPSSKSSTQSNTEEEDDASAELRMGIENIRKIPSKRLDITHIQRRLLQSTERLTAAKTKLRVLVEASDENREEQNKLKTSVDVILDRITEQTKKTMVDQPTRIRSKTPDSFLRSNSEDQHSPSREHVIQENIRSTDQVLERYRTYKATRLQMSPGRITAMIDDIIEGDEGEI